jgi:hypothetical protein
MFRGAWHAIGSRFVRQCLDLAAIIALGSATAWGIERALASDDRLVWGEDLAVWVHRLDSVDIALRDSAITAVSELSWRAWEEREEEVRAAVAELVSHLADPDSLLREHAVYAILDMTERNERVGGFGDSIHRQRLRAVVREGAAEVIRAAARPGRRPWPTYAALEVLVALGAPPTLLPSLSQMARQSSSSAVREMALLAVRRGGERRGTSPSLRD